MDWRLARLLCAPCSNFILCGRAAVCGLGALPPGALRAGFDPASGLENLKDREGTAHLLALRG